IEGAWAGGVDSLLVLTGVTTPALLLAAEPRHRPTYVAADLRGLLAGQPEVVAEGGNAGFRCGGWSASVDGDGLRLGGEGEDRLDGLRALCAAAWTAAGKAAFTADCGRALARLGW
ncbi:HAD hydrolase-like protein, partial [Streptomyces palmae]